MAPRRGAVARTAFNVSGLLSFTITRNCCGCSYMESRASLEFEVRPGVAGSMCCSKQRHGPVGMGQVEPRRDSSFEPPVVAAGNILLVLRYPMAATLTTRAVRGEH
ncbi:hypothetical protein C2845_PM11G19290 [Panicum miliaceum]|uniref:Uncharacterized protein n=1 Tax=Panicum miliaceum TaxID=4540 RepID=A0A3L6RQ82_PANMI|nr:hypothetical protein C2845_PM11G19290 [Panicum miliaceum]